MERAASTTKSDHFYSRLATRCKRAANDILGEGDPGARFCGNATESPVAHCQYAFREQSRSEGVPSIMRTLLVGKPVVL
eukprot:6196571-Pleurochrysis_carterae.AAC.2